MSSAGILPAETTAGDRDHKPGIGAGLRTLAVAQTAATLSQPCSFGRFGELGQWAVASAYTTSLAPCGLAGRYVGGAASATE